MNRRTASSCFPPSTTHRVTYRFLGLLLVTLGVAQGGPLVEGFGNVVCVLLGGCAG
ncbi:gp19.5 family protein [Pseudomonas sp. B21-015]|uniref:gp19.5 family protein n=1 Tax=unclassified Pseudomonas TaxID=196821 RepID=UPI0038D45521